MQCYFELFQVYLLLYSFDKRKIVEIVETIKMKYKVSHS